MTRLRVCRSHKRLRRSDSLNSVASMARRVVRGVCGGAARAAACSSSARRCFRARAAAVSFLLAPDASSSDSSELDSSSTSSGLPFFVNVGWRVIVRRSPSRPRVFGLAGWVSWWCAIAGRLDMLL